MTTYKDSTGREIRIGDTIEHITSGEQYLVCEPGTGGFHDRHDGPILLQKNIAHRSAFRLNERRAIKARVVA